MASWGRTVDEQLTGVGTIDEDTNIVTGTGTNFQNEVEVGNLISLDDELFKVMAINSETELEVVPVASDDIADEDILRSEIPKFLPTSEINNIVLVGTGDIDSTSRSNGIKTPGWTLYEEYGNGRKRVETLVAMKSTS